MLPLLHQLPERIKRMIWRKFLFLRRITEASQEELWKDQHLRAFGQGSTRHLQCSLRVLLYLAGIYLLLEQSSTHIKKRAGPSILNMTLQEV